jgi:hypothetical protein
MLTSFFLIFKRSKIAPLCISIEAVKVAFFLSGVEVLQVLVYINNCQDVLEFFSTQESNDFLLTTFHSSPFR